MKVKEYRLNNWDGKSISRHIRYADLNIVILKINDRKMPLKEGHRNLVAINESDEIIWIAELPDMEKLYSYYDNIELFGDIVKAWCGSCVCEIEPLTGRIIKEVFVK